MRPNFRRLQVTWYKNGNIKLFTSDEIVISENEPKHSLRIEQLRERNFGGYKCRAQNDLGWGEAGLEVTGRGGGRGPASQH